MEIYKVMKYRIYFFLIVFVFMIGGLWASPVKVIVRQPVLPVLTLKEANPVLRLEFVKQASGDCAVREIVCSLKGSTDLTDIEHIRLYASAADGTLSVEHPLTLPMQVSEKVSFKEPLVLKDDTTLVWVTLKLKDRVNLSHRVRLACSSVKTVKGKGEVLLDGSLVDLRLGVAVRQFGQDGVNTSRIPGIATSKNGTLLAVYDARYDTSRDLQGNIDIALNRSFDGGETWQPMQVVLDMKTWGGLPEKYNGVSDACILVDEKTGDIYVAGLWMHGVLDGKTGKWVEGMTQDSTRWIHQWHAKGSQPGRSLDENSVILTAGASSYSVNPKNNYILYANGHEIRYVKKNEMSDHPFITLNSGDKVTYMNYTVYRDYEYLVVGTGKGKLLFYDAKTMKENPELLKEFDLGASIVSVKEVDAFSSSGDRY